MFGFFSIPDGGHLLTVTAILVFDVVLKTKCVMHTEPDCLFQFLQCHSVHSSSWFPSDAVNASSLVNSDTFSHLLP